VRGSNPGWQNRLMSVDVIGRRALNRATLHRQHLLARTYDTPSTVIEHLVGLQGQNPLDPYFALWSRVDGFDPSELAAMLVERSAVRAPMMRGTIHLVTTGDYLRLQPVFATVLARVFGSTSFAKDIAELDREELLECGRAQLVAQPTTRAELSRTLSEQYEGGVGPSMAQAVTYLLPVVQTTPRGVWGSKGTATWALGEAWVGRRLESPGDLEDLVMRYLRAFGPATISDMRTWSGLAGLREVFDRARSRLRIWQDEEGRELFDLAEAVHPDPDTPAPARFLPEYDNVLLGHSDRSRFFSTAVPEGWVGNLLVDGMFVGSWKVESGKAGARLTIKPQVKLGRPQRAEIQAEGSRLLEMMAPGSAGEVSVTT